MNWLWFIPILLVMVVIHELGHFLTARWFGMKVHEFGIGFPPKVWSKKTKDGMEWSINALPIGGFVRIEGENGDSNDPNAFGAKPTWQRAIVLAAGPFMNIVLALAIYWGVNYFGGKEFEAGRPAIIDVSPNSPAATAGLRPGDVFVTANGKPVKTIADFRIETTLDRNNPVQIVIDRNGQMLNFSVMPRKNPPEGEGAIGVSLGNKFDGKDLLLAEAANLNKELGLSGDQALKDNDQIVAVDGQPVTDNVALLGYIRNTTKENVELTVDRNGQKITQIIPNVVRVDFVFKGSSAEGQKLPPGSIVTRLDDKVIKNRTQYEQYLRDNAGKEIKLYYKKNSAAVENSIVLLGNTKLESGAENRAPRVANTSFSMFRPMKTQYYNPLEAASESWNDTVYAIMLIPRTFKALFDGSVSFSSLAGPIGMAQITDTVVSQSAEKGFGSMMRSILLLMAMLSVNLGIVNILPLPALDGGRLIFVFIEMITRGRRVPPEKESLVHLAGMVALLTLMVAIAWQDIIRLVTGATFQ